MNKLEYIIKSKEYQDLLFKHFEDIGFEFIDNEQQKLNLKNILVNIILILMILIIFHYIIF